MYKKILFLVLGILLCAICLFGCSSIINEPEIEYLTIIDEFGESEYTLIRSDIYDIYMKPTVQFKKSAEEFTNGLFKITTDWKTNPVSDKEIVIGKTTREDQYFDIDRNDLGEEGFIIMVAEERVVIAGINEVGTLYGVNYFFQNFVREDGSVMIPKNYYYRQVQEFPIKKLTINGNDIGDYQIVYNQVGVKVAAELLQKYIMRACGKQLEVVSDSKDANDKEILIGRTNRENNNINRTKLGKEGYVLMTSGAKLFICGENDNGTISGVYDFLEKYLGWRFMNTDDEYVKNAGEIDIIIQ